VSGDAIDQEAERIGVVVLHFRNWPGIRATLDSILEQTPPSSEVVVVDNVSCDGSVDAIRAAYPTVRVLERGSNDGYGPGMNAGITALGAHDSCLVMTHDCLLGPGCLQTLAEALRSDPELGIVGPLIAWRSRPDRVFSIGGVFAGRRMVTHHRGWEEPVADRRDTGRRDAQWLEGACLLIRTEVFSSVGSFDEHYFMYFEEIELCVRASRAGWKLACDTGAIAWQEPGQPSHTLWTRNRLRFVMRNFPARIVAFEVAGRLEEIGARLLSRDRDDRRRARSMLHGIAALPLGSDPSQLYRRGMRRDVHASGRAHTA
jgi:GT2 family glycosyltransferase